MAQQVNIEEFARKVERLCEFLLSKIEQIDGSPDVKAIQDLKDNAVDIQMGSNGGVADLTITGLDAFLRGHPQVRE